ncbi:MAG: hypothetical protein K0B81_09145 [Candidatus Cloacimonetes bacterium]|nr:hypothetical protein [Candidatus Cloacimonadota bacterium]
MLDILQSAIIAIVIAVLIFGIHLMTMRTKQENDVIYRMQREATSVSAIIQEELKSLYYFDSDPDYQDDTFTLTEISFINTQGHLVSIEFDNEARNLIIEHRDPEDNSILQTNSYRLNLDEDNFTFSLRTRDNTVAYVKGDVDLIMINVTLRSRDEDFYQDMVQQFTVNIGKDHYLRNIQLQRMIGTY